FNPITNPKLQHTDSDDEVSNILQKARTAIKSRNKLNLLMNNDGKPNINNEFGVENSDTESYNANIDNQMINLDYTVDNEPTQNLDAPKPMQDNSQVNDQNIKITVELHDESEKKEKIN